MGTDNVSAVSHNNTTAQHSSWLLESAFATNSFAINARGVDEHSPMGRALSSHGKGKGKGKWENQCH